MENQHRKISGYRELSQDEIDLMNAIKALGPQIESTIVAVEARIDAGNEEHGTPDAEARRWANLARDHLQQGLMCLTRAVAKPEFF